MRTKYAVDRFKAHFEIEEILNNRSLDGWELVRIIECSSIGDRDYVTIIWEKEEDAKEIETPEKETVSEVVILEKEGGRGDNKNISGKTVFDMRDKRDDMWPPLDIPEQWMHPSRIGEPCSVMSEASQIRCEPVSP